MLDLRSSKQWFIAMTHLGFNNKEIASATGVSSESIRAVAHPTGKKYNTEGMEQIRSITGTL